MGQGVVDGLVRVARPIILEHYDLDSCVASTRIAIEALAYFGVRARPLMCRAMLWNKVYADDFCSNRRPLDNPDAFAIGIGYEDDRPPKPEDWWAHLIAVTDEQLIDLSIDQASRPQWGIRIGPLALPLREELTAGLRTVYTFDQGALIYEPFTDPAKVTAYQSHRNWRMTGVNKRIVGKVIRAMKAELEHG